MDLMRAQISDYSQKLDFPFCIHILNFVQSFHDHESLGVPLKGNVLPSRDGSKFGVSPDLYTKGIILLQYFWGIRLLCYV